MPRCQCGKFTWSGGNGSTAEQVPLGGGRYFVHFHNAAGFAECWSEVMDLNTESCGNCGSCPLCC